MRSVFTLDRENKVILSSDAVKLCPNLKTLTENELLYIIWAYDYRSSPARLKPEIERKDIAQKKFFANDKKFKEDKIKKAIEDYVSLIFCPKRSRLESYKNKYVQSEKKLFDEPVENSTTIQNITKTLEYFSKKVSELEEELIFEEEAIDIGKGKQLTWIELEKRRKAYLRQQGIEE